MKCIQINKPYAGQDVDKYVDEIRNKFILHYSKL